VPEFHDRFLAGDVPGTLALLAPDASFHSPAADYQGHETIARVFTALAQVISDAQATAVWRGDRDTVVAFSAVIAERHVDGMLRVIEDGHGKATDVTLLVRPLAALLAGVEQMKVLLGLDPG
jgi:hypothetical protein